MKPDPPAPSKRERELLKERDICAMLGVSRVTLYHWRRAGAFPQAIRLGPGRMVRWRAEDVETWMQSRPSA